MVKRILAMLLLILVVLAIYLGYKHRQEARQLADGEIRCVGCMSPEEKARFEKRNALEASDSQAKAKVNIAPATDFPAAPSATIQTPPPEAGSRPIEASGSSNGLPASDSLSPDPPNGVIFSGKGSYQWYRQGNLTWRLNTKTGASCVAFATLDEWQNPIVAHHGCSRTT
jgi:hypothetical protein